MPRGPVSCTRIYGEMYTRCMLDELNDVLRNEGYVRWMAGCSTGRKNAVIEAAPSAIPIHHTQSIWCLPPLDTDHRPWALPAIKAMLSLAVLNTVSSGVFIQGLLCKSVLGSCNQTQVDTLA